MATIATIAKAAVLALPLACTDIYGTGYSPRVTDLDLYRTQYGEVLLEARTNTRADACGYAFGRRPVPHRDLIPFDRRSYGTVHTTRLLRSHRPIEATITVECARNGHRGPQRTERLYSY